MRSVKIKHYIETYLGESTFISRVEISKREYDREMKQLLNGGIKEYTEEDMKEWCVSVEHKEVEHPTYVEVLDIFEVGISAIQLKKVICKDGYLFK